MLTVCDCVNKQLKSIMVCVEMCFVLLLHTS